MENISYQTKDNLLLKIQSLNGNDFELFAFTIFRYLVRRTSISKPLHTGQNGDGEFVKGDVDYRTVDSQHCGESSADKKYFKTYA